MLIGRAARLSETDLENCRPVPTQGGEVLRAYCPFHGSDKQRSLRVNKATGRFSCYACEVWGYLGTDVTSAIPVRRSIPYKPVLETPSVDLSELAERYRAALPGSLGERYLKWRGIPLELAMALCVGYAEDGKWAHRDKATGRPVRQWKYGRLVFPHTDVKGRVVNLYGRAIGSAAIPKAIRHDHLRGPKGYFNAMDLDTSDAVYICEGPFDALSLLAAGASRAVAIFGVAGWRWEWARTSSLIFSFDADEAGTRWRSIAWEAVLRGKSASVMDQSVLGGCKDLNEAWTKGLLKTWDGLTLGRSDSKSLQTSISSDA